ncbi:hypothetical protein TNCV_1693281 [Trichonephila clavipes]|nr:hypothetical protein TNCV_1693281 [Trichonephila clavipes]
MYALCSSECQGDFRLTRLPAWLFGWLSLFRGSQYYLGPTVRPQSNHMKLAPQFLFGTELVLRQFVGVLLLKAKIAAWESMKKTTSAAARPAASNCDSGS